MDRKVGDLLDTLEQTGLAENTLVVFASDHGDMLCEKEMVQKRCFYEWSCRVPLIARFPAGWQAGTVCDTPVSLIDLLPTFCEIAGTEASLPHDGESLIGILDTPPRHRIAFAQAHEAVGMPCIMARQGPYTIISTATKTSSSIWPPIQASGITWPPIRRMAQSLAACAGRF